jgi:hypothetical protein
MMMNYDLARLVQDEIRKEVAAGRLVNQAQRARSSLSAGRARFEGLRRLRRSFGVTLIRLGLSMAGRDVSASAGTPMI